MNIHYTIYTIFMYHNLASGSPGSMPKIRPPCNNLLNPPLNPIMALKLSYYIVSSFLNRELYMILTIYMKYMIQQSHNI